MPNNTENTLASRIDHIKVLKAGFPNEKTISDLKLSHLLDIFLYREKESLFIFPSLIKCIQEKAEGNKILLYLSLNLEKEHDKAEILEILSSKSKGEIEQQINNCSKSELPEPSFYKGWGFRFSESGISEQDGKLYIKIDDIFDGSKLTEHGIEKGNIIIIDNPESFKTDGKFDIGKIAQNIRIKESLNAIKNNKEEVIIEQGEKKYFYQDEKNSKFIAFSIKENISIEEATKQEEAILSAFKKAEGEVNKTPSSTPSSTTSATGRISQSKPTEIISL